MENTYESESRVSNVDLMEIVLQFMILDFKQVFFMVSSWFDPLKGIENE